MRTGREGEQTWHIILLFPQLACDFCVHRIHMPVLVLLLFLFLFNTSAASHFSDSFKDPPANSSSVIHASSFKILKYHLVLVIASKLAALCCTNLISTTDFFLLAVWIQMASQTLSPSRIYYGNLLDFQNIGIQCCQSGTNTNKKEIVTHEPN